MNIGFRIGHGASAPPQVSFVLVSIAFRAYRAWGGPRLSGDRDLYPGAGGGGVRAPKKFVYLTSTSNFGPL